MPDVLTDESLNLSNFLTDPTVTIVAHLAKSTIANDGTPVTLGSLTECDFPGYAPIVNPNFNVFQHTDPLQGEAVSDPLRFTAAGLTVPQIANALYLTIQKGTDPMKFWQIFPLLNPWDFDIDGRSYAYAARLRSIDTDAVPVDQGAEE